MQGCYEVVSKKDKEQMKAILASKYVKLSKDEYGIKLYEIDKQAVNEASNEFFGSAYSSLSESQKEQAVLIEAIINNCKYYVKKTDVINAPQFVARSDMSAYPFYDDWVRFDAAWKQEIGDRYKEKTEQGKKIYDISQVSNEWTDFCKKYFGIKKTDIRYKARKTFSIIALATPPGTVFRLKRKTHKKDSFVYQAVAIDNQQVSGDYAIVLLKNGKQTIAFAGQKPSQNLKKEIIVKETKEIRDEKIEPSRLFVDGFDVDGIEVVLKKTSASIKNFPLDYFKNNILWGSDNFEEFAKSTIPLLSKGKQAEGLCAKKDAIDAILKLSTRDGKVSGINIKADENLIDFVLPFKNTQKLIK